MPKKSHQNIVFLNLGPKFTIEGTLDLVSVKDLCGFKNKNGDQGELITGVYLTSIPIATKNKNGMHLINHDHPQISEQIQWLSDKATIWVLVLENDCDDIHIEKIRFLSKLSFAKNANSVNDQLDDFIKEVATNSIYQNWLKDHYNLGLFEKPGEKCPVNASSLATILGLSSSQRVIKQLKKGWKSHEVTAESPDKSATRSDKERTSLISRDEKVEAEAILGQQQPPALKSRKMTDISQKTDTELLVNSTTTADLSNAASEKNEASSSGHSNMTTPNESDFITARNYWTNFLQAGGKIKFETWHSHLKKTKGTDYSDRFIERVIEIKGDTEELSALQNKIIGIAGYPDNGTDDSSH